MPLIATRGAASAQGFGEFSQSGPVNYIEEVFSTYLYTGTGASQTITNNIDLSTKGGLVWLKSRSEGSGAYEGFHNLFDTVRGATKLLKSNTTDAQATNATSLTAFSSTGFSIGGNANINDNGDNFVSWTFRKQPKFFDIVTYTGNDAASRNIAHNLGSTPGCIIIKNTSFSGAQAWVVWHRTQNDKYLQLWKTDAVATDGGSFYPSSPTSTNFTIGPAGAVNDSASNYVAYLFAHDAGGFGLTGSDNVISCGSYTGNGTAGLAVTLGYESQWVLIKQSSAAGNDWIMYDQLRGMTDSSGRLLYANSSYQEQAASYVIPNATGFTLNTASTAVNGSGSTYIYIAIRRGPMKVPTLGTSVFTPAVRTGTNTVGETVANANFPVDLIIGRNRASASAAFVDRLRGINYLRPDNTDAEASATNYLSSLAAQSGWVSSTGGTGFWNTSPNSYIQWYFKRAPGYFDMVCYTGTGSATTFSHNLAAVPELMIVKSRSSADFWRAYSSATGNTKILIPNTDDASITSTSTWNSTTPTSSVFTLGTDGQANGSGKTFVNYLFATCAGVSKVGSYTGTGATQTINCGFTAGSRFVMIKRTDSTGDWYVWDSARGIIAGNDPYLLMNTIAAEVTGTDYVDTANSGFEISSTAPAAINANGGTFIFLAIA